MEEPIGISVMVTSHSVTIANPLTEVRIRCEDGSFDELTRDCPSGRNPGQN